MSANRLAASRLLELSDHHGALRDSVARVVAPFGREYFQRVVKLGEKPTELWHALGQAGFLGVHIGEEWGGAGGGLGDLNVVIEETAAQGCPLLYLVIQSICAPIIEKHGSEALKQHWLPGLASGELKMAFAITEPDAGTNTHRIATRAKRMANGWVLNGKKHWTSGLDEAEAVLVVARDEDLSTPDRSALSLFIVPARAKGISAHKIDAALMSPENQYTVFFDDVEIGEDALIGEAGKGLAHVFEGLNPERVCAAAINNGIACYALNRAATFAKERKVWRTSIGAHQGVAHPMAEAYMEVQAARLMTATAAQMFDNEVDAGEAANMAKFLAAESSLKALDQAMQTHGGLGLAYEYGLADLWFIARLHRTAPVSREMILNYIAKHSLDLEKSY